jgi:hypothetical protein
MIAPVTIRADVMVGREMVGMSRTIGPYGVLYHIHRGARIVRTHDDPMSARIYFFWEIENARRGKPGYAIA